LWRVLLYYDFNESFKVYLKINMTNVGSILLNYLSLSSFIMTDIA